MATLTKLLTNATNPSKDFKFNNGNRRYVRYDFDVTILPADGTNTIDLGSIYPQLILEHGVLSFRKIPSEVGAQKFIFQILAPGDANSIGAGTLAALPAAGAVNANYGFPHSGVVASVDYLENYSATIKFADPPFYDASVFGVNLQVHLDSASLDVGGIHLAGMITMVGYDLSRSSAEAGH